MGFAGLAGEELADCLLGGSLALFGGRGAVAGLLQRLLQGFQLGGGHCGGGTGLVALITDLLQSLSLGGEFLADPAGLGTSRLDFLVHLITDGLSALGAATNGYQVGCELPRNCQ
ncbi:hypothetical protein ACLQ2R_33450 [Streptosporangium sp. DT93]|uniref:hypothetical protein n=1 Tax=Streptosporangium sp. DT93 TaxID=3393428 RepID=UPI003CF7A011